MMSMDGTNKMDELSGVTGWRNHDLRRTARSHWSAIPGISDTVKELMLAHVQPGIRAVYDRFGYRDQKRALLVAWEQRLMAIVSPPSTDNVVPIVRKPLPIKRRVLVPPKAVGQRWRVLATLLRRTLPLRAKNAAFE